MRPKTTLPSTLTSTTITSTSDTGSIPLVSTTLSFSTPVVSKSDLNIPSASQVNLWNFTIITPSSSVGTMGSSRQIAITASPITLTPSISKTSEITTSSLPPLSMSQFNSSLISTPPVNLSSVAPNNTVEVIIKLFPLETTNSTTTPVVVQSTPIPTTTQANSSFILMSTLPQLPLSNLTLTTNSASTLTTTPPIVLATTSATKSFPTMMSKSTSSSSISMSTTSAGNLLNFTLTTASSIETTGSTSTLTSTSSPTTMTLQSNSSLIPMPPTVAPLNFTTTTTSSLDTANSMSTLSTTSPVVSTSTPISSEQTDSTTTLPPSTTTVRKILFWNWFPPIPHLPDILPVPLMWRHRIHYDSDSPTPIPSTNSNYLLKREASE